ncbi:glycerophosphodiester phosphodiesterase [Patescibacteria group bacterium]|nr:MAG: glycerophosphodiester phosphodiesterase [Patescibacteria group bacterium]
MLKIGHRGACGYAPENTLKSFQRAIDLGVDMIELDVHLCKSGELIVIHDDTVDRTTDGSGFVKKLKLKDLKKMNTGEGERIPTLEEVLDLVNRRVRVNIELKGPKTAKPVMKLIEEYVKKKGWNIDDFIISSFSRRELKKARAINPLIQMGFLISRFRLLDYWWLSFAEKIGAYFIGPSLKITSKRLIRKAHKHGLRVYIWTVNDPKDIERMRRWGADGVFSNFP